jgi:hypothetical protein
MRARVIGLIFVALLPAVAQAAEESSSGRDVPAPGSRIVIVPRPGGAPPQVHVPQAPAYHRPPPVYHAPPPVYHAPRPVYRPGPPAWGYGYHAYGPPPRPGFTCSTRRFECDLYRPRPIGSYCECPTPFGDRRPGRVTP